MSNKPKRLVQQPLLFPALSTKKRKQGTGTRSAEASLNWLERKLSCGYQCKILATTNHRLSSMSEIDWPIVMYVT